MLEYRKNFEMSVPFGTIRGKIWHRPIGDDHPAIDDTTIRVLALHGWQDNCGTFDTLIPLLPENLYVVAIDFPGHGLSSHIPAGCPYNDTIFVIEVERTVQYLGWKDKSITILGHSMGAAIGMFYACLYPTVVKRLISLDMIKPLTFPLDKLPNKTREGIEQFLQLEAKILTNGLSNNNSNNSTTSDINRSSIPLYDHNDALSKLIAAHSVFGKITPESAEILLKRGSKISTDDPTKVYFTRDNRLKAILFQRMDNETLLHYFRHLSCELLIIKAHNGARLDPEEVSNRYLALYGENCQKFVYVIVPGGHHVHLCNPEHVYQKIIDFIYSGDEGSKANVSNEAILKLNYIVRYTN